MHARRMIRLALGLVVFGWLGCKKPPPPPPEPQLPKDGQVVLVLGEHDSLEGARKGLEAALRLRTDLPLPFPRVERRGDRYRVVLGRGKGPALQPVFRALRAEGAAVEGGAAGEGGDDVVRLGIVCAEGPGKDAPLYAPELPLGKGAQGAKEAARLPHGQVVVLGEDEGGGMDDESEEAAQGFVRVLAPRAGLVKGTDVLLPADCTPRDEDNDDGNGRLLAGGRLCLTTRFQGKDGEVMRASLVAVAPSYRRCTRFPDAGTFDGFDQAPGGAQFAVESGQGLAIYDVSAAGELAQRLRLPGLSRPAYLGEGKGLVAAIEDEAGQGLALIDDAVLRSGQGAPTPRRIFQLAGPRFAPAVAMHRPAAPTFDVGKGRVRAAFRLACNKAEEGRVKAVARGDYEQCMMEVEVEVPLTGGEARAEMRCHLNNAPSPLDQPLSVPCR
jgi:hypothetical protein